MYPIKSKIASVGAPDLGSKTVKTTESFDSTPVPDGRRILRLIDYHYDEKRQLVFWKVDDLTPGCPQQLKQVTYAWLADDLFAQYGIRRKNLPAHVILTFSKDVKKRKEPFYMDSFATARRANFDWLKKSDSYLQVCEAHDELDYYPYHEVLSHIEEEKRKKK